MDDLVTTHANILKEDTESLKLRLSGLLARTASDLQEMAEIVAELDSRKVDLHGLRIGLLGYLRRIATGTLAPEAVVRFASAPALLERISTLPIDRQRDLARGETVALAVWQGESVTHRLFDPLTLTTQQQKQVFGSGEIRSVEQQIPLLTHTAQIDRTRRKAKLPGSRVRADRKTGDVIVNRTSIPYGELLAALSELSDPTPDEEPTVPVQVKLTTEQHRRLKVHCAKYECTIAEAITLALAATGVFRNPL